MTFRISGQLTEDMPVWVEWADGKISSEPEWISQLIRDAEGESFEPHFIHCIVFADDPLMIYRYVWMLFEERGVTGITESGEIPPLEETPPGAVV